MSTAELRKIAGRFIDVKGLSDLEVHHEAVILASQALSAKALHKALDQRHAAVIARFSRVRDEDALASLWDESLAQGEIPGAYWALLTHRDVTAEIRKKAFGDVHMLSHLVGAANRADIRRLVALEQENAGLRERLDRQALRAQELTTEHDQALGRLQEELADVQGRLAASLDAGRSITQDDTFQARESNASLVAIQTQRRERAEQATVHAMAEAARVQEEMDLLRRQAEVLSEELAAAEIQLRETGEAGEQGEGVPSGLQTQIRGRRILYVGGRPSSMPAIRGLVVRNGGEFQRHGGGAEDRKGLLASAVAAADLVVFPVDCIDHDSAGNLKRLCARQGIPFIAMRKASVASFAAAMAGHAGNAGQPAGAG
ncbi:MAG: DUF2325 domain-containing protein [Pseudomonadota bacterium]